MKRVLVGCALSLGLYADAPRGVEVFGHVGAVRLGGDESSAGTAAAYGGSVMLPLLGKWALDVSAQTARARTFSDQFTYASGRRTLVTPALVRRFGSERVYGFAGGGVGVEIESEHSRYPVNNPPQFVGTYEYKDRRAAVMWLMGKGGVVWNPVSRLLVRGDVEAAFHYVLPNLTARIGVGWRF